MKQKYMIGDVVRCIFDPTITGMVIGYGNGSAFTYFKDDMCLVLAMREDGSILTFGAYSGDYKIVDHVNMSEIFKKIVGVKEAIG